MSTRPVKEPQKDTGISTRGPVCRLREESIDWLIATTEGQTVPERDQALHDMLVVRIHQETLAVKGSCLYYVHARVSDCRRRSCSDNTAVSSSTIIRATLSIHMLDTLNILNLFRISLKGLTKLDSYYTTAFFFFYCSFLYLRTTTPPVKYNKIMSLRDKVR